MLGHKKGQYQDILTKWLKCHDNFWFEDNFRTMLKFQEFQDNWDPCLSRSVMCWSHSTQSASVQYTATICLGSAQAVHAYTLVTNRISEGGNAIASVLSACPFVSTPSSKPTECSPWTFASEQVMTIACRGLKVKVMGQGQCQGSYWHWTTDFQDDPWPVKTKLHGFPGAKNRVLKDLPGYIPFTNIHMPNQLLI